MHQPSTSSSDSKIRIAVLGCGRIGQRHMALISRHPQASLSACIDPRPAEEILGLEPPCAYFPSLDAFLESEPSRNTDIVHIATPNGGHGSQALACLKAGLHVLIEKPMSLDSREAEQIIRLAEAKDRKVFTVMQNRYSPPAQWVKSLLDQKILGRIFMVSIHCFWNRDHRYYTPGSWHGTKDLDGGTLYTQFSHFLDMMVWLMGNVVDIEGKFENFSHQGQIEFEDSGVFHFRFADSGALGSFIYSTSVWDRNMESSLTIIGEKGSLKIGGQYMDRVEYCHIKDYTPPVLDPTEPGNHYGSYQGSASNHAQVIENVIDVLQGKGEISTNGREGKKIVELIENLYAHRDEKGRI